MYKEKYFASAHPFYLQSGSILCLPRFSIIFKSRFNNKLSSKSISLSFRSPQVRIIFSPSDVFFFFLSFSSSNLDFWPLAHQIFKLPKYSRASRLVFLSFKCSILNLVLFFKLLITGSISSFGDWAAGNRWTEIAARMTNSVLKSTTVKRIYWTLANTMANSFPNSFGSVRQNQ